MLTRRELLASLPALAAAAQHAQAANTFKVLTPAEAATLENIAAEIIPTDDTPGAREAGVIWFIDAALASYHADQLPTVRAGLAKLPPTITTDSLRAIESTDFFKTLRTLTVMGFLADPQYGGNRDHIGWKTIGFSHAHVYRPPFGAYDK